MEILIILAIVVGVVIIVLAAKSIRQAYIKHKEQTLARYEEIKNGEFSESQLNKQEQALLQKLRDEKKCNSMDTSQLLLWAFIMHNHNVLPQNIVQDYELDLSTNFPQVYETYQQCYNNYCDYNSGGSYSGYSSYSGY
jgi:protein involved in sex pheromone biosynthesis